MEAVLIGIDVEVMSIVVFLDVVFILNGFGVKEFLQIWLSCRGVRDKRFVLHVWLESVVRRVSFLF
jgi:hypothetical protein